MSKDTFIWDERLAFEFAEFMKADGTQPYHQYWGRDLLNKFKQSKMPKKEWEVIEVISRKGGKLTKQRNEISWEQWGLKSFYGLKINAVKRLSDMTLWEVGEVVGSKHTNNATISHFKMHTEDSMWVYFSDCHHPCNIDWLTKLPPQSKPEQPKKERIEINGLHDHGDGVSANSGEPYRTYSFNSPKVIPTFKHKYIKEAIEKEINDEKDELLYDGIFAFLKGLKYTTEELREAEEKAFNAGREVYCATAMGQRPKYWTFEDYLKSKQ